MKKKSFRELFSEYLEQLEKRGFRDTLLNRDYVKAFDMLLKVWVDEYDSMERCKVDVLGLMNLLVAVHIRERIEELVEKMREFEEVKS